MPGTGKRSLLVLVTKRVSMWMWKGMLEKRRGFPLGLEGLCTTHCAYSPHKIGHLKQLHLYCSYITVYNIVHLATCCADPLPKSLATDNELALFVDWVHLLFSRHIYVYFSRCWRISQFSPISIFGPFWKSLQCFLPLHHYLLSLILQEGALFHNVSGPLLLPNKTLRLLS